MAIHPKVFAAAAGAAVPSLILAILTWAQDNPDALTERLPKPLAGLLILLLPTLAAFTAGYLKSGGQTGIAVDEAGERLAGGPSNVRRTDGE